MESETLRSIGGYFELELPRYDEYHADAIALNSGRFCLEYVLRCRKCSKVYLPYYTCDTVLESIIRLGIPYVFYHIDKDYHIADDIRLSEGESLIYTNYWGLQTEYCHELSNVYGRQLIFDYTQSFYARPIAGIDTLYSCRKFFGVPDGGYLYTDLAADFDIEQDQSHMRIDSLVKRIDISAEAGYADFCRCSDAFSDMPVRSMSRFTKRMISGIDYADVANRRRANYNFLQQRLGGRPLKEGEVPMIFPYESEDGGKLRQHLIKNRVYVARYWPNVEEWAGPDSVETWIMENVIPLPIDQRYSEGDMAEIIRIVTNG